MDITEIFNSVGVVFDGCIVEGGFACKISVGMVTSAPLYISVF